MLSQQEVSLMQDTVKSTALLICLHRALLTVMLLPSALLVGSSLCD